MNTNFQIGEKVNFTNGSTYISAGRIVKVKTKSIVVVDEGDNAAMELWNAGYAVGSEIAFSQVK